METERKPPQRSCFEIAMARARHARERNSGRGGSSIIDPMRSPEVSFTVTLLASLMVNITMAGPRAVARLLERLLGSRGPVLEQPQELPQERTGDELRTRSLSPRVKVYRSIAGIVGDLRRPATRATAEEALMARINDPITREWAQSLIHNDEITPLAYALALGDEEAVMKSWERDAHRALLPVPEPDEEPDQPQGPRQ